MHYGIGWWPTHFRSGLLIFAVAGTLADAACVHAFYTSVHGMATTSCMHSLLDLHLLTWFYIACLSLQSFAFLNCFNLIVIFKAMGHYCEPASCWSNDNKLKNLPKYPWMRDVTWVKFPTNSTMRATWKKLPRIVEARQVWNHSSFAIVFTSFWQGTATKWWTCGGLPQIYLLENLWTYTESEKVGSGGQASTSWGSSRQPTRYKPGRRAGGCR